MNPLFKILFLNCWSNIYLIIGICMGLSLSLFLIPVNDFENEGKMEYSFQLSNAHEANDEYEPKVNIANKPLQARKIPKMFVRPRYYSTELGIREKLFVGIITSRMYLHSRDIAINKTIAHLVDKVRYFISIPEGVKPNVSLPGIVGFTDTRSILKPFHVMKYITDNYLEDYDYYFLIKDISYINARKLINFVSKISVSQDVHVGIPTDIQTYCSLDSGILLSNSIIQEIKTNLDWCVQNTYSDIDDINFGRCIVHSSSLPCTNQMQGQTFLSIKLNSAFNFKQDLSKLLLQENFLNSLTIHPIYDHLNFYRFHMYITVMKSIDGQQKIFDLRNAILQTKHLAPVHEHNISWPIGNRPGNKPLTRFDVLHWTYFNETHTFFETDFLNIRKLKADAKFDIDHIINTITNKIIMEYDQRLVFQKLINGYKRFDASRGMDYIFDLSFIEVTTGKELYKRVEVCKPLGKVEVLSVPYVTENTRINMILIVNTNNKEDVLTFMEYYEENCMQKKYKTFLLLVLLYNVESPSKGQADIYYGIKKYALMLSEKYKKEQSKVTWHSIRLPIIIDAIEIDPMLKIAITDLCIKKFSPESLILFVETGMDLKLDYLNRVRMNTINQYQIFSPIPFVAYHPDITYTDDNKHIEVDVNHNYGRYDEYNYNNIAFYVKDYIAMRKAVETSISLARSDKDIAALLELSKNNPITSIFDMFVSFSDIHTLRAVEPALKIKYKDIRCISTLNNDTYTMCVKQKNIHLGQRSQLAKLILDYKNYQN
ncbi:chondroitin sulfate synthase 2 [Vespa velutina]|uniref:chondroitin sulfate synthase 2 n=1 Tax=Vespa velutina TaxID=202808 RepID=UPI001FB20516|nr:chondroitin sulfate synthase 2 [Vespa velutina]